ncbi:protein YgfX [Azonexus sp.]|uniref:protein YgfX n=1 Tax=Azonexus sp. TaxID=1872668 RepID=UPI0027BA2D6E|nr:protein YgfX [Azonexus sp.]
MQFPIIIGLHRSRFLDCAVLMLVLGISGVMFVFPRSTAILAGILLFAWSGAVLVWWQLKPEIACLRLQRDGRLEVLLHGATEFLTGHCLPGATVHPWLTAVRIELPNGQRLTLLATADTMSREAFRRLRVFLRWRADFTALPLSGP